MKIEQILKLDLKDCETSLLWTDLLNKKNELNEGNFNLQTSKIIYFCFPRNFSLMKDIFFPDSYNAGLIHCLHALLPPTVFRTSINSKKKKSTIKDSQRTFCVIFEDIKELEEYVKDDKIQVQPFIFIIGDDIFNIREFYIYFDNIIYKLHTLLKCIDVCFKIFIVFNMQYPVDCRNVWVFIQHFFFEIKTKFDIHNSKIKSLIHSLRC